MAVPALGKGHTEVHDRLAALLILPLVALLGVIVAVFFVFFRTAYVDGDSMYPTLDAQDRVLVTRTYTQPRRGDIVVVVIRTDQGPLTIVKRVVGLPGDRVQTRGDKATVNGRPENYPFPLTLAISDEQQPVVDTTVPAGTVFVLGDNRAVSEDSRFVGPVRLDDVIGKAVAVYSPVTRMRRIRYDTSK
ncbi:MAG: signal peptidase I [Coriobacteriaceae bacterium]|nr:signal peptidase I [Coriobacteriaceae bacterium]